MELKISEVVEKYRSRINSEFDKNNVEYKSVRVISDSIEKYELVRAILDNPKNYPRAFVQQIQEELGRPPLIHVMDELNANQLGIRNRSMPEAQRVEWVKDMKQLGLDLSQFAQDGVDNYKVLHDNIKESFEKIRSRRVNSKAILLVFCGALSDEVSYKNDLNSLLRVATFKQADTLLHELIDLITVERGLDEQKFQKARVTASIAEKKEFSSQSTTEIDISRETNEETLAEEAEDSATATAPLPPPLQILKGTLEQIQNEEARTLAVRSLREITARMERSEQENANLRTGTQIAEHRVQVLQEQLVQTQTEAERNAVTSFFQAMNSVKHSSLLDQFLKVEKLIEHLQQQETEIPEGLELLLALVNMFNQFLEMQGIKPKYDVGSKREITLNESDQYEYFGSQFENEDERKTVEVLSSGWTYEDELIIKPRVREVVN